MSAGDPLHRFIDLSSVVLEAHDAGTDVLRLIERRIGIERLREDLGRAQGIARPQPTGHLDLLIAEGGATGRKLLAAVIASVELRPAGVDEDELLAALRLIRRLADDKRRWLPGFSPSAFIDAQWRPHVVDVGRGRLDRRAYELCAAYELRSALRAGRAWVPGSRRADPSTLLLPDDDWQQIRTEFAQTVEQPTDGAERLEALGGEQAELLKRLARERDATAEAQLADGELTVAASEPAAEGRTHKADRAAPAGGRSARAADRGRWLDRLHRPSRPAERQPPAVRRHAVPAVRGDPGAGDQPRALRHVPGQPVQLSAAGVGVGAALPRGHADRGERVPGRLPPRPTARAGVGRWPAVVF